MKKKEVGKLRQSYGTVEMVVKGYTIRIVSYGTIVIENITGKIVRCFATESEAWDYFYDKEQKHEE